MEERHKHRGEIFEIFKRLNQGIIRLKDNLAESLDYIDLKRKEFDTQTEQQQDLIDNLSNEIKELENVLTEKRKNLLEIQNLREKFVRLRNSMYLIEQSVLDEFNQTLSELEKKISPSFQVEQLDPEYRKKLIEEYLSGENKNPSTVGDIASLEKYKAEEIYDDQGEVSGVFYDTFTGGLVLSSDSFMKYLSNHIREIDSIYSDYCRVKERKSQFSSPHELDGMTAEVHEQEARDLEEKERACLDKINQARERLLKMVARLRTMENLPRDRTTYRFENSTMEILNENTLTYLQNLLELDLDRFFEEDNGLSLLKNLAEKYREYREGLGEEKYCAALLDQLGYPENG